MIKQYLQYIFFQAMDMRDVKMHLGKLAEIKYVHLKCVHPT